MPASPTLAIRLDPDLIERLDDEAEQQGHTRSSLARHLLKQHLTLDPPSVTSDQQGSA